jgi:hypothetical protein
MKLHEKRLKVAVLRDIKYFSILKTSQVREPVMNKSLLVVWYVVSHFITSRIQRDADMHTMLNRDIQWKGVIEEMECTYGLPKTVIHKVTING